MIGLAYQLRLDRWLERGRCDLDCLELTAEHFYKSTPHRLRWLASQHPVIVRCSSLSLGGPDPLEERSLASCAAIVRNASATWLAHPLGFSRAGEIDLGMTVPISLTRPNLDLVTDRVCAVIERCGRPLLIEKASSHLRIRGTLPETEFLNLLCTRSGCKLLIDLPGLCADGRTHRFDPAAWLDDIDPAQIQQIRVAVGSEQLFHLSRLLTHARPRAVVLAAPPSGPLDEIDRAIAQIRATVAAGGARDQIGL